MSYEEELANHFGLQRRAGIGNDASLSVRAEGNAGQLVSSDITKFVCRPCSDLGKATSIVPLMARDDRTAAVGVDGVTWYEYERNVETNIADLHDRIHRGAYRAQPSRRVWPVFFR